MSKPIFEYTFTAGNVATIVCGVVFALTIVATLQVSIAQASQERKDMKESIVKNEIFIQQIMSLKGDIIRVTENQKYHSKQIDGILSYFKERDGRRVK